VIKKAHAHSHIHASIAAALNTTVSVIAYAEFENVIEVDWDRNVVFDFGV